MTALTCPGCGFIFESQATTATRCRHCRRSVTVPSGRRGNATRQTPSAPRAETEDTIDLVGLAWAIVRSVLCILSGRRAWLSRTSMSPDLTPVRRPNASSACSPSSPIPSGRS
jgi:hypothetical protein